METLLHKKSDNVLFVGYYSLTNRNAEKHCFAFIQWRTNPFCAIGLFVHILKTFFDVSRVYRKRHEVGLRTLRGTHSQMFFRIGNLKNFPKFQEKQLSWGLFLIKSQTPRSANLLERDSNSGVFL